MYAKYYLAIIFLLFSSEAFAQANYYNNHCTFGSTTCGTAAGHDIGTSGATVPLLNGANTWSGAQTFSALTWSGTNPFVNVLGFAGVDSTGASDSSIGVQNAINAASAAGAATVFIPFGSAGLYSVKGLSLPSNITIVCSAGVELQLPNASNTYIIASAAYVNNAASVTANGGIQNCILDGNVNHQTVAAPLIVLAHYNAFIWNNQIQNSKGYGILYTALTANGITCITNGEANNRIQSNVIAGNADSGIFGNDGGCNQLADLIIYDNVIDGNSSGPGVTDAQVQIARAPGFQVLGNLFYNAVTTNMLLTSGCFNTAIANNRFESAADTAASGTIYDVSIACASGIGSVPSLSVSGNTLFNDAASLGGATCLYELDLNTANTSGGTIAVSGNSFSSKTLSSTLGSCTAGGVSAINYRGAGNTNVTVGGNGFSNNTPPPIPQANIQVWADAGTFSPTDQSGASLTLTGSCRVTFAGFLVDEQCAIGYPSTVDTSHAKISLPVAAVNNNYGYQGAPLMNESSNAFGTYYAQTLKNTPNIEFQTIASGANATNANLSAATWNFSLRYPAN